MLKLKVTFAISSSFILLACAPNESSSQPSYQQNSITPVATFEKLFVPNSCLESGRYIYEDLRLEKYRARYRLDTLQALANLTVCLDKNGFANEAANIGLETLLLSQISAKKPDNIDLVAQIVSESDKHSYAMRAWADWTFVSSQWSHEIDRIDTAEEIAKASESYKRIHTEMVRNSRIALGNYFDQFQKLGVR